MGRPDWSKVKAYQESANEQNADDQDEEDELSSESDS